MTNQRRLSLPHPRTVNYFTYVPSCTHCIASLIAEQTGGETLHVNHEAWAYTAEVSAIFPPPTGAGLTQKDFDRRRIKTWVKEKGKWS